MAGQVVGGGYLLNIPLIQFCASVKYKLQGFHNFSVWALQMLRPEMSRVDLISPSVNVFCTHEIGIHLLIQQLFLEHFLRESCSAQIKIHGPAGWW